MRRSWPVKVLVVAGLCLSLVSGGASARQLSDRDDGNVIDIAQVSATRSLNAGEAFWTMRFRAHVPFRDEDLEVQNEGLYYALSFHFDTDSDPWFERVVLVDYRLDPVDGFLHAFMTRKPYEGYHGPDGGPYYSEGRKRVGSVLIARVDSSSLVVQFPEAMLSRRPLTTIGWAVRTASECDRELQERILRNCVAFDYAPEGFRQVQERIRPSARNV